MAIKVIKVGEDILGANDEQARANRQVLDKSRVFTINIMSSPGAGKTSTILTLLNIQLTNAGNYQLSSYAPGVAIANEKVARGPPT